MIWNWLRRHPLLVDLGLASFVGLVTVLFAYHRNEGPEAVPLALLATAPLLVRRRYPLAVLAAIAGVEVVTFLAHDLPFPLPLGAALYTVASRSPRRIALPAGVAVWLVTVAAYLGAGNSVGGGISAMVFFAAAWLLGDSIGSRRAYLEAVEERAERLEREREAQALRAAAEEQARIARELHDVVAHSVSVIVVQAAAADDVFETDPGRAREALRSIEGAARSALGDLRRVLGALTDDAEYAPQPGLDRLPALVDDVRTTGLEVALTVEGTPRPLPAAVDLSAYRIVQEALTNTLRHAAARHAQVRVRWGDELDLEIRDDGRGAGDEASRGSGRGLIGMRERVTLLGGELAAGPAFGGGYAVTARIPLA